MLSQGEAAVVSWYKKARRGAAWCGVVRRSAARKDKRESLLWKYSAQCSVHARAHTTHVQEEQKKGVSALLWYALSNPYFNIDALPIN